MSDYTSEQLTLYYFSSCPFCLNVLDVIKSLNLEIELRNIRKNDQFFNELKNATGKTMVPCLRISKDNADDIWMFESRDIIAFLNKEFG